MLGVPGIAARTFARAARARGSRSRSSPRPPRSTRSASACPSRSARRRAESLAREFRGEIARGEIDGVEVEPGMATVAVVGLGMHGTPGIAARVFAALAAAQDQRRRHRPGSSELNISVVVVARRGGRGAAADPRGVPARPDRGRRASIQPERIEVVLLGFGQIGRDARARMIGQVRRPDARRSRVAAVIDRSRLRVRPAGLARGASPRCSPRSARAAALADAPRGRARHAPRRRSRTSPATRSPARSWWT